MVACWGAGRTLFALLSLPIGRDGQLECAIATACGVGLFVCAFQWLGIVGVLLPAAVLALLMLGVLAGVFFAWGTWRGGARRWSGEQALSHGTAATPTPPAFATGFRTLPRTERFALVVLALIALPTLLAPLAPPFAFDEVMYHLPYAREVAESGRLGIYEWLRYPWFPYNVDLLYAAALMWTDDVFTHLVNALCGWLSVWIIYRLALRHVGRMVACIGACIWLALGDFSDAYIDMGVALFLVCACAALWWWREAVAPAVRTPPLPTAMTQAASTQGLPITAHTANTAGTAINATREAPRWLWLAAFFIGLAVGSKYQALSFLPIFGLFVLRRERRLGVWAVALLCFLLPCIYWYARNALQTGDPFNPIGGPLFGYTNWNAADHRQQLADVRDHANFPNVWFWPALLAPLHPAWRRVPAARAAIVFCGYALAVWLVTSRYPRYLVPAFPMLALVAALGWHWLFGRVVVAGQRALAHVPGNSGNSGNPVLRAPLLRRAAVGGLLAVLVAVSLMHVLRQVRMISPTDASRQMFLTQHVPGYRVLHWLQQNPQAGRLYQVMLSDAIYHAPKAAYGDVFGPWRYADFFALPPSKLAAKFKAQGFGTVVIRSDLAPLADVHPEFLRYFELLYSADGVKAYRIL
ncbi:MAG: hypothetical protein ABIW85_09975 [Variovorax sp.]